MVIRLEFEGYEVLGEWLDLRRMWWMFGDADGVIGGIDMDVRVVVFQWKWEICISDMEFFRPSRVWLCILC